ncbi:MAG: arsenate reductase family protein [Caulobacterales bacterium]|nr:arsenate reductase family protein [Caulobacterales bacterium]
MNAETFPVTLFHNPACGTSRNALAMVRAAGYAPDIVLYLETGWRRDQLAKLLDRMGAAPSQILRTKGTPAEAMGLLAPNVTEAAIFEAMLVEPILVNRPIVVTPLGVILARPSEAVQTVLDCPIGIFTKEDGEVVEIRP